LVQCGVTRIMTDLENMIVKWAERNADPMDWASLFVH
jgi:predicted HAD superfamily phosphohydrolase YqeG